MSPGLQFTALAMADPSASGDAAVNDDDAAAADANADSSMLDSESSDTDLLPDPSPLTLEAQMKRILDDLMMIQFQFNLFRFEQT